MDISVISLSTSWTLIGLTSAGNWTHSRSYKEALPQQAPINLNAFPTRLEGKISHSHQHGQFAVVNTDAVFDGSLQSQHAAGIESDVQEAPNANTLSRTYERRISRGSFGSRSMMLNFYRMQKFEKNKQNEIHKRYLIHTTSD
ncbi:hypothetical protein I7I51_00047 [Histoplasma capsulatum]|uniref:Uncharacterized protein n=1 Tax=Ajellomyces capsulatus TaxID=5037 RepID=A0A8A1MAI6_AJECA|nr:hypothetical protein I7I51_00047 [Histoplasma capsulatum]